MEGDSFDLSDLNLVLNMEDTDMDVKVSEDDPDHEKNIKGLSIPENYLEDMDTPLIIRCSDGKEETLLVPIDKYFRLVNKVWNHPDYAEDADIITMKNKMIDAAPYNVFFTTLKHCPETEDQIYSVRFRDLLCPSLGKLKSSLHITFLADIKWIISQFALRKLHNLPMTILHGSTTLPWPEKETMEHLYPNIDYHYICVRQKETDLGLQHSKLTIFEYEDGSLRIVIGSANLYAEDWNIYNQQVWISPPCPKLPEGSSIIAGESPTGFKFSLIDYLLTYDSFNISTIQEWIERIKTHDFRDIKVTLLFTMPGVHYPRKNGCFIHFLGHLLSRHCTIPAPKEEHDSWRIIAQTAALGLVGRHAEEWLTTCVLKALGSHSGLPYLPTFPAVSKTKFNLIYPTVQNVLNGYLSVRGAFCCYYDRAVKNLQPWLLKYQCQWKADETKRSRAMAHSKIYCRISPCWQKMAYYFLSSANLSRSSWGKVPNRDHGIYIRSYETGVLFLPKYFEEDYFEVKDNPNRKNEKLFPVMFDLPLTPYGPNDDSFCCDELVEQGVLQLYPPSVQDASHDAENNLVDNAVKSTQDNKDKPTVNLKKHGTDPTGALNSKKENANNWDKQAAGNAQSAEVKTKDMKFNNKPKADLFFPSFTKKS